MLPTTVYYDGLKTDHTQEELDSLFDFLASKKVFAFVDFGVGEGGLAYCLLTEFPKMRYLGVTTGGVCDAADTKISHHKHAQMLCGDSLSADVVTYIDNWMSEKWPTLLYCDVRDNLPVMKMYKNITRFGDFIGTRGFLEERSVMKKDFELTQFNSSMRTRLTIYNRKAK